MGLGPDLSSSCDYENSLLHNYLMWLHLNFIDAPVCDPELCQACKIWISIPFLGMTEQLRTYFKPQSYQDFQNMVMLAQYRTVQLGYGEASDCLIPPAEAVSICFKKARELMPCLLESARQHDSGREKIFFREKVLTASTCCRHCLCQIQ